MKDRATYLPLYSIACKKKKDRMNTQEYSHLKTKTCHDCMLVSCHVCISE